MSLTTLFASTILNPNNTGVLVSGNFGSASYQSGGTSYALGSLPGWSFSNSTGGYSLDGTQSFAANTPRITSAGLLVEAAATNVYGNNNQPTGTLVAAPDGTTTAQQLNLTTFAQWDSSGPTITAGTYTVSVFVKSNGGQFLQLPWQTGQVAGGAYVNVDLINGVVTQSAFVTNPNIVSVGNGWFRVSFTVSFNAVLPHPYFWPITSGTAGYTGAIPASFSFAYWGWQIEAGSTATSYIANNSAGTASRAADVISLAYTGTATSIRVVYTGGTAIPATGSPLNLGASSGGAWVGQNIQTFSIFGTASSGSGAGSVTAAATLSGAGVGNAPMAGSVTAAATLSGAGVSNYATTGSVTAKATLSGAGVGNAPMAGSVTAAATLSGAGVSNYATTGSVTATATVSGAGSSSATSSGAGAVTAAATLSGAGASNYAATGAVTAAATVSGASSSSTVVTGAGSVTAAATLSGAGVSNYATTGSVTATATVSGAGLSFSPATGAVSAAATLNGAAAAVTAGTGSVTGVATASGAATSSAAGTGTVNGVATLNGVSYTVAQPFFFFFWG